MPLILECIVTTVGRDDSVHIAPMGVVEEGGLTVIAPFKPSTTLDNLLHARTAVINYTDDVRIYAGCLTGRRDWPLRPATRVRGRVLEAALAHREFEVDRIDADELRPRVHCRAVHEETHAPFAGFNRAQAAVIEAAVLASRLHMLPREKIEGELDYLRIAIDKTAGPRELEAWRWLMAKIEAHDA